MHIYFPPGYDGGKDRYPVFYLLHGGGDEDSGWSTIGRAGFILDNLIAEKKARPMIVVMPNGSLPRPANLPPPTPGAPPDPAVTAALTGAIHERVAERRHAIRREELPRAARRARTARSLGFRWAAARRPGSSLPTRISSPTSPSGARASTRRRTPISRSATRRFSTSADKVNKQIKLFSISVGDKDFALAGSKNLAEILKKRGIKHELHISGGGHTWINWRNYLRDYAQALFKPNGP